LNIFWLGDIFFAPLQIFLESDLKLLRKLRGKSWKV